MLIFNLERKLKKHYFCVLPDTLAASLYYFSLVYLSHEVTMPWLLIIVFSNWSWLLNCSLVFQFSFSGKTLFCNPVSIVIALFSGLFDDSPASSLLCSLAQDLEVYEESCLRWCIITSIFGFKFKEYKYKAHVFLVNKKSLNFYEKRDTLPVLRTVNFLIDTELLKLLPEVNTGHCYFNLNLSMTYY